MRLHQGWEVDYLTQARHGDFNTVWVRAEIRIRRNSDGKVVTVINALPFCAYKDPPHDTQPATQPATQPCGAIWEKGNFACDCNRDRFFTDWGKNGEPKLCPDNDTCCDEGYYSVQIANPLTGEIIYDEWVAVDKEPTNAKSN